MRFYTPLLLMLLALTPVVAQQYVPIINTEPAVKPAGYYIIKLKYLSIEQVSAYFKDGGAYARYIPSTIESIAGIPSLQSIALKTADPQDVLTMTRLITQLDHPAQSYDITCTMVVANGKNPPVLPDNFAALPVAEMQSRLRALVSRQQASVLSYPPLQINLNEQGEIALQEDSPFYRITLDGVTILPSQFFPAAPACRLSHLPPAANAPTTGRFSLLHPAQGSRLLDYSVEKADTAGSVVFAYTGLVSVEATVYRIHMVIVVRRQV